MDIRALCETQLGKMLLTAAISMAPVVELRGGIPFGTALGLSYWQALTAGVLGNMIPVPFIIVYIRRFFRWTRERFPKLGGAVARLEDKAHLKGRAVAKYSYLGLFVLVAIPLPGTGAWTGALVAALLDIRLKNAVPAIFFGVVAAGFIMAFLSQAVVNTLT